MFVHKTVESFEKKKPPKLANTQNHSSFFILNNKSGICFFIVLCFFLEVAEPNERKQTPSVLIFRC